jgi:hypothetical protein
MHADTDTEKAEILLRNRTVQKKVSKQKLILAVA